MNVLELKKSLDDLNIEVKKILQATGYDLYAELANVTFDSSDPDQVMLFEEFHGLVNRLDAVSGELDYLNRPFCLEGTLSMNDNGRYELNGYELTSGQGLEVLIFDPYHEKETWYAGSIEHNGTSYYLVGRPWVVLSGAKARIRK